MKRPVPQQTKLSAQVHAGLAPAQSGPPHRFAREGSHGTASATQEKAPILVVEDDFLVAMQIEAALMEAGFAPTGSAASGEEALAMAASVRPALVLMDIRLAGEMDGVDAALALF